MISFMLMIGSVDEATAVRLKSAYLATLVHLGISSLMIFHYPTLTDNKQTKD